MNILTEITKPHLKRNVPAMEIGDTVRVHQKIKDVDAKGKERERIQIFEGIVIAKKHGNGIEGTFTVRKIAAGSIGVERVFPLHSPNVIKIERVKSAKVRRSKLYFLRDLKSAAMRLPKEKRNPEMWEERGAEAEIEAMKEETAAVAAENAEEKAEEAGEEIQATEAVADTTEVKAEEQPAETPEQAEEKTDEAAS